MVDEYLDEKYSCPQSHLYTPARGFYLCHFLPCRNCHNFVLGWYGIATKLVLCSNLLLRQQKTEHLLVCVRPFDF